MIVCEDGVLLDGLEKDRVQGDINSTLRHIKNITNSEMFEIPPNNRFYLYIKLWINLTERDLVFFYGIKIAM